MVKKRELTVEIWQKAMEREVQLMNDIGKYKFYKLHQELNHSMTDVIYELQIAKVWNKTGKQVYEFDPDFTKSILNEHWADLLADCIQNRPHDCFYMKLPCCKLNEGAVVHIVKAEDVIGFEPNTLPADFKKGIFYKNSENSDAIQIIVNTGEETLMIRSFAISKTPELMLNDTEIEIYPIDLVINGVAYICSTNADIVCSYKPNPNIKKNNAKKRSSAIWYDVGYRIGADLRKYNRIKKQSVTDESSSKVRPHVRRAHWHHYWMGPLDGDRNLILKWVAPTFVNIESVDDITTTGHKIK